MKREAFRSPRPAQQSSEVSDSPPSPVPVGFQTDGSIRVNTVIRTPADADRIKRLIAALEQFLPPEKKAGAHTFMLEEDQRMT